MDVTITATLRPEILRETLRSFYEHLFLPSGTSTRIIINIDRTGPPESGGSDAVAAVAREFGNNSLIERRPSQPCFPAALRWCWKQVQGPYFFNLEDDWVLLDTIDLNKMFAVMEKYPRIAILRLPKGSATEKDCIQSHSGREPHYIFNGDYYECPTDQRKKMGYYGSPSLIRTEWAHGVLPLLKDTASPEKQMHILKKQKAPEICDWEFGCFSEPGKGALIKDIGFEWRRDHKIRKNSRFEFTTWTTYE